MEISTTTLTKMSKNAILSLIKYLALNYAKIGIRVNGVAPGNTVVVDGGQRKGY